MKDWQMMFLIAFISARTVEGFKLSTLYFLLWTVGYFIIKRTNKKGGEK